MKKKFTEKFKISQFLKLYRKIHNRGTVNFGHDLVNIPLKFEFFSQHDYLPIPSRGNGVGNKKCFEISFEAVTRFHCRNMSETL